MLEQIQFQTSTRNPRIYYLMDFAFGAMSIATLYFGFFYTNTPHLFKVIGPFLLSALGVAATSGSKVTELVFDYTSKTLFVKQATISKREVTKSIPFGDLSYTYTYRTTYFFWKFIALQVKSNNKRQFTLIAERNGWDSKTLDEISGHLNAICG